MSCDTVLVTNSDVNQVVTDSGNSILVTEQEVSLIVTDNPYFIAITEPETHIITVEGIGPRGETGAQGESRQQYVASTNISGHVVVAISSDGQLIVADCTQSTHALSVVGITTNAVTTGNTTLVSVTGKVEHLGWTFTQGMPVYLGLNGQITQALPLSREFTKIIGIAVSPTIINLQLQPAIFIA